MKKIENVLLELFSKIKGFFGKIKYLANTDVKYLLKKNICKKEKMYERKNNFDNRKTLLVNKKVWKLAVPVFAFVILLVLILGGRIIPEMLSGNVYRVTELSDNLDRVKVGDKINYTINGYNNWRVLSVDKENGTIDVTSNTNVKDLTIEPYKTVDEYNALFQAEADAFRDGKYVVNARTIAKSDSLMFDTDGEYWLANVNENSLMTNMTGSVDSEMIYFKDEYVEDYVYVIPKLKFRIPRSLLPEKYGTMDMSVNGVDKWVYMGDEVSQVYSDLYWVYMYAASPIRLSIDNPKDVGKVVTNYYNSFNKLGTIVVGISDAGTDYGFFNDDVDFVTYFGDGSVGRDLLSYYKNNGIFNDYDDALFADIWYNIYNNNRESNCIEKKYNTHCKYSIYKYSSNDSVTYDWDFIVPKSLTFGYRPVLTLKVANKDVGKNTSENLKIGDYVKYNANGYKNWKVLSIDKDAGTVDVISGGVVKNIGMYGIEDYENYENILQREVDSYKVGSSAISARPVGDSDVEKLIDMGDNVSSMFWYNVKQSTERQTIPQYSSTVYNEMSYEVGVLWTNTGDYYVNDFSNSTSAAFLQKYWVRFYSQEMSNLHERKFFYYVGNGDLSYIAGLRPIITLKLDIVDTYSDTEAEQLENTSHDYDYYYFSEQYQNNFNDDTSSLLFRYSSDSKKSTTKKNNSQGKLDGIVDEDDCDFESDSDSDVNYGDIIDADLVETNEILEVAVFLSVIYGLIMIGLVVFAIVYRQKKKNQFLDS